MARSFFIHPVSILLIINIVMSSGLFSVLFYNANQLEQARQISSAAIVAQVHKKLDTIHNDTSEQINLAGNVSQANNRQLIQITHILNDIKNSHATVQNNYNLLVNITHMLQQQQQQQNRTR
jgi:hypothetical protein